MAITLANHWLLKNYPTPSSLLKSTLRVLLSPFFLWRSVLTSPYPIVLQSLSFRLGNPQYAKDFYNGKIILNGTIVYLGSFSPFSIKPPNKKWEEALHSFTWLCHLSEAKTELANAYARTLLKDWLQASSGSFSTHSTAWRADIVSERLISWLSYSSMLLKGKDTELQKKFLRALTVQLHYLQNIIPTLEDNRQNLYAHIALSFSALCLHMPDKKKKSIFERLEKTLAKQIYPDGGHVSRSPYILSEILLHLTALKESFTLKGENPPQGLINAIDRMLPFLRFFLHKDHSLARFNGVGPVSYRQLENIFCLDESHGKFLNYAPHSGYLRFDSAQTTLIADIGKAPKRHNSHYANAGCLSFEMSSGTHSFIVNSGIDPFGPQEQTFLGRLTAAHSTASINDTPSCLFEKQEKNSLSQIIRGPDAVDYKPIKTNDREGFVARHDGYKYNFGITHERGILLHNSGKLIEGYDLFYKDLRKGKKDNHLEKPKDTIKIRFHLHPDVEASFDNSSNLRLEVLGGDAWLFSCPDGNAIVEESIFFADVKNLRRTKQIVLTLCPETAQRVRWRFIRIVQGNYNKGIDTQGEKG